MVTIQLKNLHKRFGELKVLCGIDLEISSCGIFAVLGPNGSGKTTLIKSILGMVIPDQGEIFIDQQSVLRQWEYRDRLSYLPQIANFPPNLTVQELLGMVRAMRRRECRQAELIALFGLESFLGKKLGKLSGGTKQKVNLVLAFMFDNEFIVLDEPTNGLDPIAIIRLKDLLESEKDRGKTILITTHIMSLVEEIAKDIVFLLDGKIYFRGSVETLLSQTQQGNLERAIAQTMSKNYA